MAAESHIEAVQRAIRAVREGGQPVGSRSEQSQKIAAAAEQARRDLGMVATSTRPPAPSTRGDSVAAIAERFRRSMGWASAAGAPGSPGKDGQPQPPTCTATHQVDGKAEPCALAPGHEGKHRDASDAEWSDDDEEASARAWPVHDPAFAAKVIAAGERVDRARASRPLPNGKYVRRQVAGRPGVFELVPVHQARGE